MLKKTALSILKLLFLFFSMLNGTSCNQNLVPGNYLLSSTAGTEEFANNFLGRATRPTIKQKKQITRPGSSILFVEYTTKNSNRIKWDHLPVVVQPDEILNKSLVNLLNESLANIDASNANALPLKGEISLEKIASVSFTVDTIHRFISVKPDSEYDYSTICSSSLGIYNGKIKKSAKGQLNYIQRIFQISGKFELKANEVYKASLQAEIENLPVNLKSSWSKKNDDTFEYELDRTWAVVEVVPLPKKVCEQVAGQYINRTEVGLLKKKNYLIINI